MLAVVRAPSAKLGAGERTYVERQTLDRCGASTEHELYCKALLGAGCRLLELPTLDDLPDATFVEDTAVVLPECVAMCAPGADSRRAEADHNAPHLEAIRRLERPPTDVRLDGGDVLQTARHVFVGLSTRTNEAALDYLQNLTSKHVVPVEVGGSLHLKTALTRIDGNLFAVNPEWVDPRAVRRHIPSARFLEVPRSQPFAANVLRVGWALLVSQPFAELEREADLRGLRVLHTPMHELGKAEAGPTCLTILFEDED